MEGKQGESVSMSCSDAIFKKKIVNLVIIPWNRELGEELSSHTTIEAIMADKLV